MNRKEAFLKYQAQITKTPFLLDVEKAQGSYIYTTDKKKYIDLVAGVSSCTLGHSHPAIISAVKKQLDGIDDILLSPTSETKQPTIFIGALLVVSLWLLIAYGFYFFIF